MDVEAKFIDENFGYAEFTLEMFAQKSGLSVEEARNVIHELLKAKVLTGAYYAVQNVVYYQKMGYDWTNYKKE